MSEFSENDFAKLEDPSSFPGSEKRDFSRSLVREGINELLEDRTRQLQEGNPENLERLRAAHSSVHELITAGINGAASWDEIVAALSVPFASHMKSAEEATRRAESEAQKAKEAESRAAAEKARADYDELTGLRERDYFKEGVSELVEKVQREQNGSLAFSVTDLDDFGVLNKTKGIPKGDEVLQEVGAEMRRTVREGDVTGRWGGEELAAASIVSGDDLRQNNPAERIRKSIKNIHVAGVENLTASVGATKHVGNESVESMIARSSIGLNLAKLVGKNRTMYVEPNRDIADNSSFSVRDLTTDDNGQPIGNSYVVGVNETVASNKYGENVQTFEIKSVADLTGNRFGTVIENEATGKPKLVWGNNG